jgi:hypothetical protein
MALGHDAERRRGVDDDPVVLARDIAQAALEQFLFLGPSREPFGRPGESKVARGDVEVGVDRRGLDHVAQRQSRMTLEEILQRRLVDVEADSDGGMRLGVEIHEQAALAVIGDARRE